MFPYYGTKKSLIKYYPSPHYDTIIEPFGGSCAYSLFYSSKNVHIYEIDKCIYDILKYLIEASEKTIINLPLDNFESLKQVEKDLIGFFIRTCCSRPSRTMSKHKNFNVWTVKTRKELSINVNKIKHWKIYNESFDFNLMNATYFIDPPYIGKCGGYYKFGNKLINYVALSNLIKSLKGQIIVCENGEANWLPFEVMKTVNQRGKIRNELIYLKSTH